MVFVADCEQTYLAGLRNADGNGDGLEVYEYLGQQRGSAVPQEKKSDVLTVKRTLHVEVDSMGREPDGTIFDADDLWRGEVPDPRFDAIVFADAFRRAYVDRVLRDTLDRQRSPADNASTPWRYHFNNAANTDADLATLNAYFYGPNGQRGTDNQESARYWVVYMSGIYEFTNRALLAPIDNDPDERLGIVGLTSPTEPEYSMIIQEVHRDVLTERGWGAEDDLKVRKVTTLHEVGHQFGLGHSPPSALEKPDDIMWAPRNAEEEWLMPYVPFRFKDADIASIRGIAFP